MSKGEVVAMAPQARGQIVAAQERLSIEQLVDQVAAIQQAMKLVMKDGEHYGKIPGVAKPSLWKPGAEKLCLLFRMDSQYESVDHLDASGHLTVKSRCTLYHIPTGQRLGSGEGSCSTRESKYAYRTGKRACPRCGVESINRSKYPDRGAPANSEPGWYCYAKQGGCGATFVARDSSILEQQTGKQENPDLADSYNTVLKMANKRSQVAAVLNVTAASDLFTQDLEDLREFQRENTPPDPEPERKYTDAEIAAANAREAQRSAAKRSKPQADPPEAGFGPEPGEAAPDAGQRYGKPITQKQRATFWASCDARAKDLGIPGRKEDIGRKLLAHYGLEHSTDIGVDIFDEMILMLSSFQVADLG